MTFVHYNKQPQGQRSVAENKIKGGKNCVGVYVCVCVCASSLVCMYTCVCVFLQRERENEDQTKCVCCAEAKLQVVWAIRQVPFEILQTSVSVELELWHT